MPKADDGRSTPVETVPSTESSDLPAIVRLAADAVTRSRIVSGTPETIVHQMEALAYEGFGKTPRAVARRWLAMDRLARDTGNAEVCSAALESGVRALRLLADSPSRGASDIAAKLAAALLGEIDEESE